MHARVVLYQHLTVRSISQRGAELHVTVADPNGTPRWINWCFASAREAAMRARIVEHWRRRATRLTYVSRAGETALVDDAELFRAACA
jgi:hypothetical protein